MTRLEEVEPTCALVYEPLTFSAHVTSVRFRYPGSRLDVTRKQILAVEMIMRPPTSLCRLPIIRIHRIPSLARMKQTQFVPHVRYEVAGMAAFAQPG